MHVVSSNCFVAQFLFHVRWPIILWFFGSTWENKVQTAYISIDLVLWGRLGVTCAYNNKPWHTTAVVPLVRHWTELVKKQLAIYKWDHSSTTYRYTGQDNRSVSKARMYILDHIFCACWKNRSGQLPIPFSFKCTGMLMHCYWTFGVIEDYIPHCMPTIY